MPSSPTPTGSPTTCATQHGVHAHYIPYGAPIVDPGPARLAEVGVAAHQYHLVVARFEPENHVREIVAGYVASQAGCR